MHYALNYALRIMHYALKKGRPQWKGAGRSYRFQISLIDWIVYSVYCIARLLLFIHLGAFFKICKNHFFNKMFHIQIIIKNLNKFKLTGLPILHWRLMSRRDLTPVAGTSGSFT